VLGMYRCSSEKQEKYVCTKGGEYDKQSVQTQNMVALSPLISGFQSGIPSLSLLYQAGLHT
jgi:hypothetical protein